MTNAKTPSAAVIRAGSVDADSAILELILDAVLNSDRAAADARLATLVERGVFADDIVDRFIPAAARRFGESWCSDGHSFAEVTIAVARLQGWLRSLLPPEDPFLLERMQGPEILVVVPEGSHHTLGAMVATAQFRRLGAAVQVSLGEDAESIGARVRHQGFHMVAISAAGSERLEFLRAVVNNLRTGLAPAPVVVLGGPILWEVKDAGSRIGADFATSSPQEALALCDPTISTSGAPPQSSRSLAERAPPQTAAAVR